MIYPKKMAFDKTPLAVKNCARVHKTLYQYKNDFLRELMEDQTMVVLLIVYLRENGLRRLLSRVHSPPKLEAYLAQINLMLTFCPQAPQVLESLGFNINSLRP